jgi:protein-disulfide isomerase
LLVRVLFGAALVIAVLLAYQQFSHKATVQTMSEAHPDFIMGNQNAEHTVMMFFDYGSKWSRRTHPVLLQLISRYTDTRVVLIDYPGVTDESEDISRVVLASRAKGKYKEMHNAIMNIEGDITEDTLFKISQQLGLNYDELKKIGQSDEISRILQENTQAAFFLGIEAAPSFVIDGDVISGGGLTVNDFRKAIQAANRR